MLYARTAEAIIHGVIKTQTEPTSTAGWTRNNAFLGGLYIGQFLTNVYMQVDRISNLASLMASNEIGVSSSIRECAGKNTQ